MGSGAQPFPNQAGQPGLRAPHQPQQLQGIDQQPYRQLGWAQGQSEQALAQSQQSMHHVQQFVGPTYQSQSQAQVQQLSNQSEVPVSSHDLSLDQRQPSVAQTQLPEQPWLPVRQLLQDPRPYERSGLGSMQAAAGSPAYAGHVMQDQQKDAKVHFFMQPIPLADQQICFEAPGFRVAPTGPDDIASNQSLYVTHWVAGEANSEVGWHGAAADQARMPIHSALVDNVHPMPQPSSASREPADAQRHNCFVPSPQHQAPHQCDPSAAASISVELSTAPQSANSLGDKMSSLERLRMAAVAPVAQQYLS